MKYTDQIYDDGAVIGYRPDIRLPKKEINTNIGNNQEETVKYLTEYANNIDSNCSETIKSYVQNTPGITLNNLNEVNSTLEKCLNKLISKFNDEYPNSNIEDFIKGIRYNEEYEQEFLKEYDKIDGSIIPSIIKTLVNEQDFVNNLITNVKKLYYNNEKISDNEIEQLDNKLIQVITANDLDGNGNNYLLLSLDGTLNKSIINFTDKLDASTLELTTIANIKTSDSSSNTLADTLTSMYDNLTATLETREKLYKQIHLNLDTSTKSLYNYYDKRNKYNNFYIGLNDISTSSELLGSEITNYQDEANNALKEVNKTLLSNLLYVDKVNDILTEKQNLLSLYATFSSN